MNTTQTTHPSHENLAAFNSGRLGVVESAEVERHLADCEACCRLLTTLPNETLISLLGPQSDTKAEATPSLPPQQPNEPRPVLEATIIGGDFKTQAEGKPSATLSTEVPAELQGHPRYRIQALLGRGGMGSVYQAEHRLMNRPVALKVIDRQLVQTPGLVERFHREVQAAAKLSHPNIVTAYDAEQAGDLHYLVMELVKGQDLAEVVRQRGRLPIQEACEYVRQAAQGLQHASERGMVHRDIKPQNLMLQASPDASAPGVIKILDFGLAQFATEIAETSGLTQVGSIMGTPDYMAPEQARDAHSADIRADIYSLGCTLYCLLSGGAPFPQGSIVEKIMAHVERQPKPLQELRDDVPPGLAVVLAKMMAKAPVDRFQTPAEVAEALLPFASPDLAPKTSSLIPQAATRRPRSPLFIATSVLGVLATLVLLGVIVIVTDQGRIEVRSEVGDVELIVKRGGEQIDIFDAQTGSKMQWFFSGEFKLELKGDRNDIVIHNDGFQLTRWGKQIVTLTRKPKEPAAADPPKAIAKIDEQGWHGWTKDAPPPAIAPFDAEQAKQHQEAWARYLGVRAEYTNSVGMKFRLIPPGEFTMGSTQENVDLVRKLLKQYWPDEAPKWEEFLQGELPQHKVILTKPFYLGVHEVTQAQYAKVIGENPSHFSATGGGKEAVAGMDTSSFPAEMVNWHDAVDFCTKLSQLEKLSMPASGSGAAKPAYRLPTEAEWEFACRAGTTARFWFGEQFQNLEKAGWAGTNRTHAVGELRPNPFALYDMHGNVGEWVEDLWEPNYYAEFKDKPALDPASLSSDDLRRIVRGGLFHSTWIPCQSSSRVAGDPFGRINHAGMRVALSVDAVRQATEKPEVKKPTEAWQGWPKDSPAPAIAPFDSKQAKLHQEAWAEHLGVAVEHTNSIGMKFVLIPPGEFMIGSTPEEIAEALKIVADADDQNSKFARDCSKSEGPRHKVILTQPHYLGMHEVTQAQYEKIMGKNPSHFAAAGQGKEAVVGLDTANHPVESVSWHDAIAFCAKLSQQENLPADNRQLGDAKTRPSGNGYRLPTEAEWEFSCRAGTTTKYLSGNGDEQLDQTTWIGRNSGLRTHAVGELQANPFGLHDVQGNVSEWCQDLWELAYYNRFLEQPALDPSGPVLSSDEQGHLLRGGAWNGQPYQCRASFHHHMVSQYRDSSLGFRVSLSVEAVKMANMKPAAKDPVVPTGKN